MCVHYTAPHIRGRYSIVNVFILSWHVLLNAFTAKQVIIYRLTEYGDQFENITTLLSLCCGRINVIKRTIYDNTQITHTFSPVCVFLFITFIIKQYRLSIGG